MREDPQECKIFPGAPLIDMAKGPRIREHPLGRTGDQGGREFLQGEVEVPSAHPEVVHGEGDEALSRVVLYRPYRDRILSEFSVFGLRDNMIGAFRGLR